MYNVSRVFVLVYVLLLPVQFPTEFGLRFAPSDLVVIPLLLAVFTRIPMSRHMWSIWHWFLVMSFVIATAVFALEHGYVSQYGLVNKSMGISVLLLTYAGLSTWSYGDWSRIRWVLSITVLAATFHVLVALPGYVYTVARGGQIYWLNYYAGDTVRLAGMLVDPNAFGGLLVLAFALHLSSFSGGQPFFRRWHNWVVLAVLAIGIGLTASRSAWIALAGILLISGPLRPRVLARIIAASFIAVAAVFFLLGREHLIWLVGYATRQSSIEARLALIQAGLEMFARKPLFGAGLGEFYEQYGRVTHNTLVWFLAEFGLLGLIAAAGFISWFIVRAAASVKRAVPEYRPIALGLLLAHLSMVALSGGIEAFYQRHWWTILALIAASSAAVAKQRANVVTTFVRLPARAHGR